MKDKIQQRKALARDVLKQIEAGHYVAYSGYGLIEFIRKRKVSSAEQLQKFLRKGTNCEVCGIGALFLSYVRKNNRVLLRQLEEVEVTKKLDAPYESYAFEYTFEVERELIEKKLKYLFNKTELQDIENAFEGREGYGCSGSSILEERLIAICENIIENGYFSASDFVLDAY